MFSKSKKPSGLKPLEIALKDVPFLSNNATSSFFHKRLEYSSIQYSLEIVFIEKRVDSKASLSELKISSKIHSFPVTEAKDPA